MTMLRFVVEWALRSSFMVLCGAALLRMFRVKDASIRLAAWTAILCASVAMPLLMVELPGFALMKAKPAQVIEMAPAAVESAPSSSPIAVAAEHVPIVPTIDWKEVAVIIYAAVVIGMLLRLCVGVLLGLKVMGASRRTGRAVDGVEMLESERISVPVTLGVVRPAIVVPKDWREWDDVKLEAVMAHERSHVGRRDPLVQVVSALHRAVLWPTPLSWYLHRQIVRLAEEASDDAALAAVRDRESYAGVLLDFMRGVKKAAWQGVAMARCGKPEQRIRRVLDGNELSRGITLASAVAILTLALPLTYVAAAARPQEPASPKPVPAVQESVAATPTPATSTAPAKAPVTARAMTPAHTAETPQAPATPQAPTTQAPAATQASSSTIRRYIVVQGDSMSGSWDSESEDANALRARYGDNFAWFRQSGHEYIVTDANVMADLEKAMEPQKGVNRKQAEVNKEQARVNGLQHTVNAHQNDVNALQNEVNRRQNLVNQIQNAVNHQDNATLVQKTQELQQLAAKTEASQDAVNRKQAEVNQEQSGVNAEQSKVNAMQAKVNEEQHRVSAEFSKRMQEILDGAVKKGVAKEIR